VKWERHIEGVLYFMTACDDCYDEPRELGDIQWLCFERGALGVLPFRALARWACISWRQCIGFCMKMRIVRGTEIILILADK